MELVGRGIRSSLRISVIGGIYSGFLPPRMETGSVWPHCRDEAEMSLSLG